MHSVPLPHGPRQTCPPDPYQALVTSVERDIAHIPNALPRLVAEARSIGKQVQIWRSVGRPLCEPAPQELVYSQAVPVIFIDGDLPESRQAALLAFAVADLISERDVHVQR